MNSALVILATASGEVGFDVDLEPMIQKLGSRRLSGRAVPWDDLSFDWSSSDLVVNRSTWDYCDRLDEYLAWTRQVSRLTRFANPAEMIEWNSDKRYINYLVDAGVPVVQTVFFAPGERVRLPPEGDIVVKPTVSAGARDTARYDRSQRSMAEKHIHMLAASGRSAMVQPYLSRISEGERALVYLGGDFSHAVRKGPVLTEAGVIDNHRVAHPNLVDHIPTPEELRTAEKALAACPRSEELLYARVDIAVGNDGNPVIMEVELIEPNLFCTRSENAMENFVEAIAARLAT